MRYRPWRSAAFLAAIASVLPVGFAVLHPFASSSEVMRPIANDCAAGYVEFTFDDGPGRYTPLLFKRLKALHLKGTFFAIGKNIENGGPRTAAMMREMVAAGNSVQNHTYDHASITGASGPRQSRGRVRVEVVGVDAPVLEVAGRA